MDLVVARLEIETSMHRQRKKDVRRDDVLFVKPEYSGETVKSSHDRTVVGIGLNRENLNEKNRA